MRAKRSKKYRKLMNQYALTFGFREPYQVLVDSHFLAATHSYKMELLPALERTLQGKVKPMITKCTLSAILKSSPDSNATNRRPPQLPPPTVLPLRHCSHNDTNDPIDEVSCLVSLLSSNKGNSDSTKKNKEHYILATADPVPSDSVPVPRGPSLRHEARLIPGVPIIYVKRSVVVLEPMSGVSENVRDGVERGKFRGGIITRPSAAGGHIGKRKRDDTDDDGDDDDDNDNNAEGRQNGRGASGRSKDKTGGRGLKKPKGPNPLSVMKSKKKEQQPRKKKSEDGLPKQQDAAKPVLTESSTTAATDGVAKAKRKRRHKGGKGESGDNNDATTAAAENGLSVSVEA